MGLESALAMAQVLNGEVAGDDPPSRKVADVMPPAAF
jgi:hypothetical protein